MEIFVKHSRRVIVTIFGFILLALGIIMLITPGPGWLFIILGLGVLATEYIWAKNLLQKAKLHYEKAKQKALDKIPSNKKSKDNPNSK